MTLVCRRRSQTGRTDNADGRPIARKLMVRNKDAQSRCKRGDVFALLPVWCRIRFIAHVVVAATQGMYGTVGWSIRHNPCCLPSSRAERVPKERSAEQKFNAAKSDAESLEEKPENCHVQGRDWGGGTMRDGRRHSSLEHDKREDVNARHRS